ncbi:hypothetical protein, partial [Streptomyces sp. NPDC001226]
SVMDTLKKMLTGGGERIGQGHDEAGRPDDMTTFTLSVVGASGLDRGAIPGGEPVPNRVRPLA